jgi:hypothetical protein
MCNEQPDIDSSYYLYNIYDIRSAVIVAFDYTDCNFHINSDSLALYNLTAGADSYRSGIIFSLVE